MDQVQFLIHANVGLHAEELLVPLTGLMHVPIPLPLAIPGGGGSVDNAGIYYRALSHHQTLLSQVLSYRSEDLLCQLRSMKLMRKSGSGEMQMPGGSRGKFVRRPLL
ncbi:hypothetical protein FLM9_680 [Candidatus Synechococcus spongiarum]|uniref:Uncharacterized protein n=1 Tax=Candidatus Synechococcus spongiarum TaxID=431041 RepID=A0A161KJN1_9SYNE|nr:hypothetical protein FLM9_680 [Candidatus Synechococcus spongiarum]